MPSIISWRGDAPAVAQITVFTVGGTWTSGDTATLTVNGKNVTYQTTAATVADVCTGLAAAWNASTNPEMMEATAAAMPAVTPTTVVLTADTAGVPFTVTKSVSSSLGTVSSPSTTAGSGPNDVGNAANYSGGALPTTGDTWIIEGNVGSLLWNLDALNGVTLALLQINPTFGVNGATIGLPRIHGTSNTTAANYYEYRPQYLEVGATVFNDLSNSGRVKVDFGTVQTAATVINTGQSAETNIPCTLLKGTHASNVVSVLKGSVGIAFFAGETSTVATLNIGYVTNQNSDSNVQCGSGVTLTTVVQAGGKLAISSNVTTFTQDGGTAVISGAATVGTGIFRGTISDQSSGTWTTVVVAGIYDHRQSLGTKTITNLTCVAGAEYHDPFACVTLTNGLIAQQCPPGEVLQDVQPNVKISYTFL